MRVCVFVSVAFVSMTAQGRPPTYKGPTGLVLAALKEHNDHRATERYATLFDYVLDKKEKPMIEELLKTKILLKKLYQVQRNMKYSFLMLVRLLAEWNRASRFYSRRGCRGRLEADAAKLKTMCDHVFDGLQRHESWLKDIVSDEDIVSDDADQCAVIDSHSLSGLPSFMLRDLIAMCPTTPQPATPATMSPATMSPATMSLATMSPATPATMTPATMSAATPATMTPATMSPPTNITEPEIEVQHDKKRCMPYLLTTDKKRKYGKYSSTPSKQGFAVALGCGKPKVMHNLPFDEVSAPVTKPLIHPIPKKSSKTGTKAKAGKKAKAEPKAKAGRKKAKAEPKAKAGKKAKAEPKATLPTRQAYNNFKVVKSKEGMSLFHLTEQWGDMTDAEKVQYQNLGRLNAEPRVRTLVQWIRDRPPGTTAKQAHENYKKLSQAQKREFAKKTRARRESV